MEVEKMNKLEKKYIKSMVKEILEIESEALQCNADDFYSIYEIHCFAERIDDDINYYINKMIDRNVNKNIIVQLNYLKFGLYYRNMHLSKEW
jgi:hypothetical protein